ncbi:MAG: RluA family pseudouridine synthase [Clostridiales bacterium]|nr:RluA family pseudouridine synthase [Clostridiales bacterium]
MRNPEKPDVFQFKAGEAARLDLFLSAELAEVFGEFSRSAAQKLIEGGAVLVSGKARRPGFRVSPGEIIEAAVSAPAPPAFSPEDIPVDAVFEDEYVIVVNKPAGMVVHPAAGHFSGTLVNALLYRAGGLSGVGGPVRAGIVHRIDKDTSGLLVVAKTDAAHINLARQFFDHSATRVYTALAHGVIKADSGVVDKPIGRHPKERKKMAQIPSGRRAVTRFTVLRRFAGNTPARRATLLEARLETGRTHQIRVHLSGLGFPLVGDELYGGRPAPPLPGQALHAGVLGFAHPGSGEYMEFSAAPPAGFIEALERYG